MIDNFRSLVTHNEEFVVEILREVGLLTQPQVEHARIKAGAGSVVRELIDQGLISEEDVVRTLAAQNGMEFVDLTTVAPPPDVLQALDVEIAKRYRAVPVALRDGTLVVAIGDPMDMETADALSFVLNREIEYVCATPNAIRKSIGDFYGTEGDGGLNGSGDVTLRPRREATRPPPGMRRSSRWFRCCCSTPTTTARATFISSRWRRNSACASASTACCRRCRARRRSSTRPSSVALKIMSGSMSIAEKRIPQDGRIQLKLGQEIARPARLEHPDHSRREHRHAYPGQELARPGAAPTSAFFPTTR